jgi:hypothetical protein
MHYFKYFIVLSFIGVSGCAPLVVMDIYDAVSAPNAFAPMRLEGLHDDPMIEPWIGSGRH